VSSYPEGIDPETTTLAQAWAWMEPHLLDGITCLLCGGKAEIYYQPLNREMALFAAVLARRQRQAPGVFHPIAALNRDIRLRFSAGSYARLRAWGAAEQGLEAATWRATDVTTAWVTGGLRLPRYVRYFMNNPLGPPQSHTKAGRLTTAMSWRDALGNAPFDLDAFLAGEG
jgi:hypothetical protein